MENQFFTLQEAAVLTGKSVQTLRRMIKKGELKAQRVKTPQGFRYMVNLKEEERNADAEEIKEMLFDSTIQNVNEAEEEAEKSVLTNQSEILTNQTPVLPHKDQDFSTIDKYERQIKTLQAIINAQHQEKMVLYRIMEKLQDKLLPKIEKKSFWKKMKDWLNEE